MIPIQKRSFALFILVSIIPALLHSLGNNDKGAGDLTIYTIKGPSGIGLVRLFEEPPLINGFNIKVEALPQADLMAARFISGEARIGILPPNMAAKIASAGMDIRAAAVIGGGMLSLLSSDPSVKSIGDLKGKSIEVAGQGATPDYVFKRILKNYGLDPDRDLTIGYSLAYPEIAQSLIAGKISLALLPEPFATMALTGRPDLKSVSDVQEEWVKAGGSGNYPMTLLVVNGTFAELNSGELDTILDSVKESIEWVRAHPAEAGLLAEKHDLGIRASVAAAAIPKSNIVFIPALEARSSLESLFKVFLEYAPSSIGGTLPGEKFYLK